jgi:hypothetical protein
VLGLGFYRRQQVFLHEKYKLPSVTCMRMDFKQFVEIWIGKSMSPNEVLHSVDRFHLAFAEVREDRGASRCDLCGHISL